MNRERYTRSRQPAQRLDKRPQRPAAPSPKRLVGDIITYQDSTGRDLEADEDDYDDAWPPRLPSSAINYQKRAADVQTEDYPRVGKKLVVPSNLPPGVVLIRGIPCANVGGAWMKVALHDGPPPGAGASPQRQAQDRQTEEHVLDRQPSRRRVLPRVHWLVFVGSAFLLMVGGWVLFNSLTSWLQGKVDDARYGMPRTFQTDAVVGHQDSPTNPTHFQCINLERRIQVIEFPGGDSSQSKVYEGPKLIGPGQDLTPCTLSFRDVNGDGKPDMILSIGGNIYVMINDGAGFRSPKPGEHINV